MAARTRRGAARDVVRDYPRRQFVAKLRRLADCLEQGGRFQIQIGGERVSIPSSARISLEHERGDGEEEVEFQLSWSLVDARGARRAAAGTRGARASGGRGARPAGARGRRRTPAAGGRRTGSAARFGA
jgi:amphi-Trp domain-containing protein